MPVKQDIIHLTGGLSQSKSWCQMIADIFDCETVPVKGEGAALGAAIHAAWVWKNENGLSCDLAQLVNPFIIFDNKRDSIGNPRVKYLIPSTNASEASSGRDIDFVSDGFKIGEDDSDTNGGTSNRYMYMAMAEIGGNGTLPPTYGR